MIQTPIFKAHLRVEIIPGEGVLLLAEDGVKALHGRLYEQLAPLIDGTRGTDRIVDAIGSSRPRQALLHPDAAEENGHIAEATPDIAPETTAFWHGIGISPRANQRHVKEPT